ncbi:MAG: PD-(D/E)XK nuclease family protein [Acidobacteriota bacterium]
MALTPELIDALERGELCLTGTARLARFLSNEYAQAQQARGLSRWPTPQVMTLVAWLDRLAASQALALEGTATIWLTPTQETLLWRQIIESSPQAESILNLQQAAEQAALTWKAIAEWQLPMRAAAWELSEDTTVFREWAREFYRRCRKAGVQSRAQLPDGLIESFAKGLIVPPATVFVAGMLDRTPRESALFGALASAGSSVVEYRPPTASAVAPSLVSYPSPQEEMRAAAQWARERLVANPAQRLAIIVPDLAQSREQWDAVLTRAFPNGASPPFHFSLGRPLATAGIIQSALRLAELTEPRVSVETAGALLLSPHLAGARDERIARAWHSLQLRERGGALIALPQLAAPTTPVLSGLLVAWEAIRRELPAQQTPSRWARQFSTLFRHFGWPGIEPDSTEYQMIESLRDALSELASLDAITGPVTARQAAEQLSSVAHEQVFQVEDLGEPLQLLGAHEAIGERFDAAWLAGFHGRALPPQSQPLPLVPIYLQRAARMSRAVPELWLERSRAATSLLLETAPKLIITYARADGEEPLLPSPLIAGTFDEAPAVPQSAADSAPLEHVDNWQGPAYEADESRGGASLLRDQAQCPFRSFAAHRLGARELPEAELGLSAQERGILLHAAIANCWKQLKDLATLKATSADPLAAIIRASIRRAIQDCSEALAEPFDLRVREVEQNRLERLLALWMDVEREREAHFTVIGSEAKRGVEAGGLRLTTRYDRQDQLDDGRLVLIDYKSNAPSPSAWDGERPDEPQIPLYAISVDQPIAALAFGQLKRSEVRFRGVADDAGILPKLKAGDVPIAQRVEEWKDVLGGLAGQYRDGFAAVDPKSAKVCERCHLPALCRINEAPPRSEEDDDDGA